jgi:hypothetical protein
MSLLNGNWHFYYSEEQAEEKENVTYVNKGDQYEQFTEAVHDSFVRNGRYEPHKDRFEDSKLVGKIKNPIIKRVR